ncbi:MAG: phosphodiester glycosidase family protein [Clostridia bacterium]|nr:phosphodiester glycosidase family protein [Clostridia bacterium]
MKKFTGLLAFILMISTVMFPSFSLSAPVGSISGESNRIYEEIKLSDGTSTGVRYTQMDLNGTYGSNRVLQLVECDLSNTNLSIDVLSCGNYTVKRQLITTAAANHSVNGKTVLAAVNGDMWMTGAISNSNVTKKALYTTRGVMIIDREIWTTQEFGMENYVSNVGQGTTASLKSAFGVTSLNQPLVGAPVFTISVTNETKNATITADGLNRLPAWDSLVVYNHRINSSNYALNDSYEVVLEADSTAFTVDNNVTAKVTAIYPCDSTERPAINSNSIILTARGSRVSDLKDVYSIGDTVSFDFTLVDVCGKTELWQDVVDAIGGHIQVAMDDNQMYFANENTEYPTTLIGIKDDGTVMFTNVNYYKNGYYRGLNFRNVVQLCNELGYNSVFYLDGGGSSSMVTLQDGTYTMRNCTSDGTPRAVVNGIAMVWNDTPVCEKQGSLAYIETKELLDKAGPEFISAGVLNRIAKYPNDCAATYNADTNKFILTTTKTTSDPLITFDYSLFSKSIEASDYKYMAVKLKSNNTVASNYTVFYCTGETTGASPEKMATVSANSSRLSRILVFPLSQYSGWEGKLNNIRFDIFDGATTAAGTYVEIDYIALCKNDEELQNLKDNVYPLGSIRNYNAYKECNNDHKYTSFSEYNEHLHIAECESCLYTTVLPHEYYGGICKNCDSVSNTFIMGDINDDGNVNALDMFRLKLFIKTIQAPSESEREYADTNRDGYLNAKDTFNISYRIMHGIWPE